MDIDPGLTGSLPIPDRVREIAHSQLNRIGKTAGELRFIFTRDDLLSHLKKEFFKQDQLTDVIAFRLNEYTEESVEGEVYISLERARENAREFKESESREVARLILHGCFHLLGYDDQSPEEKQTMQQMEDDALEKYSNIVGKILNDGELENE